MHEVNKVTTFKSEIYIKLDKDADIQTCIDICKNFVKNISINIIFTQTKFMSSSGESDGVIITITNDPLNPEEEDILKKHTFTLMYKIKSKIKNAHIYGLYKDISFFILDVSV